MECHTILRYGVNSLPVYKPKRKFDTLDEAIQRAKEINSEERVIHKVVAYKCKQCHKYHIGRNGKELKEKDRNRFRKSIGF